MREATQWFKNGDHPQDYSGPHLDYERGELRVFTGSERQALGWEGDVVRYYRHPEFDGSEACAHCGKVLHVHGWIDPANGRGDDPRGRVVCPGDYVVTGEDGRHYPVKPDAFAALLGAAVS